MNLVCSHFYRTLKNRLRESVGRMGVAGRTPEYNFNRSFRCINHYDKANAEGNARANRSPMLSQIPHGAVVYRDQIRFAYCNIT